MKNKTNIFKNLARFFLYIVGFACIVVGLVGTIKIPDGALQMLWIFMWTIIGSIIVIMVYSR